MRWRALLPLGMALSGLLTAAEGPDLPNGSVGAPVGNASSKAPQADPFAPENQQMDFADGLLHRKLFQEAAVEYARFLKEFPKSKRRGEALFGQGEALFSLQDYTQAEALYQQALQADPKGTRAALILLRIGTGQAERGEHASAETALAQALKTTSDTQLQQAAAYALGRSRRTLEKTAEALKAFAAALPAGGHFAALSLFAMGEIEMEQSQPAAAVRHFQALLKEFPQHRLALPTRLRLAQAFCGTGDFAAARQAYAQTIALASSGPEGLQALLGLAWMDLQEKKPAAAEGRLLPALSQAKGDDLETVRYFLGLSFLHQKKYKEAAEGFASVQGGAYRHEAMLQRTWALLGAADLVGGLKQAQAYLQAAPQGKVGECHYLMGALHFRKADYASAAGAYALSLAAALHPYREEAAFQLGVAWQRSGRDDKAATAYEQFLKAYPASAQAATAVLQWGHALRRCKRFAEAIQRYRALRKSTLKATPALREQSWAQEAVCHYELKALDAMDGCYRAILKEFPQSTSAPEALYWVAWGAQRRRQWAEAVADYGRFLKHYPKHALADRARYRLGMTHFQADQKEKAAATFFAIVTKHPQIVISQEELLWLGGELTREKKLAEASRVYDLLLTRHPGPELKPMALYYQAEVLRQQSKWAEAVDRYRRLIALKAPQFSALGRLGLGMSLRRLKRYPEARGALEQVDLPAGDPLLATYHLEMGLLAEAQKRPQEAVRHLMRVGLLFDDAELCGQALFASGRVYEAQGQIAKARTCYGELLSTSTDGYGKRYGVRGAWSRQAREALARLDRPQKAKPVASAPSALSANGEKQR